MSTKPQQLKKIIDDLRQIIVGKVAMPTDQIEQITLFLFLKQLSKKHDALVRIGSKELIFTGDWERYHFDVLIKHSGEELVKECREAVESLYKNPNIDATVRKVFERSYLKILEPKVLSSFLSYLNDKFSDGLDLGDFYESLLPILGTQNELGQFRTPRHIIGFIVRVIDPNIGEKIADPACGTAGFLVAAFNYLKEKYTDEKGRLKLNPEQTKKLYNETIFGWDMEPLMVKFSLANLYLHGLKVPNVSENDTLLNENLWQHTFDIIIANPPFITPKGGARRHSRFAISANKTEVLFCEWMIHHLNFNGRMGIIVPEGIIFDASKGHQAIRKLFLDNGLWCVVSLPQKVFNPYSPVKTSIVFLDKTLKPKQILFYEIANHGFSLNTNPTPIDKNDLPNALEVIKKCRADLQSGKQTIFDEGKYYTIPKQKILENASINLTGGIHREKLIAVHHKYPLVEIGEICSFEYGKPLKEENRKGGDYPVFGSNGIVGYHSQYLVKGPFIIVGRKGTAGAVVFSEKNGYPIDTTFYVQLKDTHETNLKFFYYVLGSIGLEKLNNQAGVPGINRNDVYKITIPLPSLEIQEQIVAELEGYQKVIDGARAVVENWKPMIEIDTKWEEKKLGEIITLQRGYDLPKQNWIEGKFPIVGSNGIIGFHNSYKEKGPGVVTGRSGTIGKVHYINHEYYWPHNTALFVKDFKGNNPKFIKVLLESLDLKSLGERAAAVPSLDRKNAHQLTISIPPIETQKQIVAKIEEEQKIVEANKKLVEIMERKITKVLSEI